MLTRLVYDAASNVTDTYTHNATDDGQVVIRNHFIYDTMNRQIASILNYSRPEGDTSNNPNYGVHVFNRDREAQGYYLDYPDQDIITLTYYDRAGNPFATIDSVRRPTWLCYDNLNRLERMVVNPSAVLDRTLASDTLDPEAVESVFDLEDQQQPCNTDYAASDDSTRDLMTTYVYDPLGRVVLTADPLDRCNLAVYDALDNATRTVQNWAGCSPFIDFRTGPWTTLMDEAGAAAYDPQTPDQNIISTAVYDVAGRNARTTDYLGRVSWVCLDALARTVRQVINGIGDNLCAPGFNPGNPYVPSSTNDTNVMSQTVYDALGNVRSDAVGELLSLINGYSYANGNPVNMTDPSGMIAERDISLLRHWDSCSTSCSKVQARFIAQQPDIPCSSGIGFPGIAALSSVTYCIYPQVAWIAYEIYGPALTQVEAAVLTPSGQGNQMVAGPIAYPYECETTRCYGFSTVTALPPDGIVVGTNVCSPHVVIGFAGCADNQLLAEAVVTPKSWTQNGLGLF